MNDVPIEMSRERIDAFRIAAQGLRDSGNSGREVGVPARELLWFIRRIDELEAQLAEAMKALTAVVVGRGDSTVNDMARWAYNAQEKIEALKKPT